jgi:hypothetical protein
LNGRLRPQLNEEKPTMRTMMKCFLTAGLAASSLLSPIAARTANAQIWSSVASGCVLDSAGAAKAINTSGFGTVSFKGAKLGHIKLTCPVTGHFGGGLGPWDFLGMTISFYDTDGTGTACSVRAALLRTNLDAHERGSDIVDFDSNTGFVITEPETGRSTGHVNVPESVYFGSSYYWVQLDLVRSSTSCNVVAVGAYLVPFIP